MHQTENTLKKNNANMYQIFNTSKDKTMYQYIKFISKLSIIVLTFVCRHASASQMIANRPINCIALANQIFCHYMPRAFNYITFSNLAFIPVSIQATIESYYVETIQSISAKQNRLDYIAVLIDERLIQNEGKIDKIIKEYDPVSIKNNVFYELIGIITHNKNSLNKYIKQYSIYIKIDNKWHCYSIKKSALEPLEYENIDLFNHLKNIYQCPIILFYQRRMNSQSTSSSLVETIESVDDE